VKNLFALTLILLLTSNLSRADDQDRILLQVVPVVDLSRYTGKWYEIARLPNKFQKDCAGEVIATYSLLEGGKLKVVNQCRKQNGRIEKAEGKARLANKNGSNSKLEVRFAPPWLSWLPFVWGDYWIIELAEDYSYSVVGTPDRKYLWILSRAPQMDEGTYKSLIEKAEGQGFNVAKLMKTSQSL
jgi:apolipoprotein D and lipocalin family protein